MLYKTLIPIAWRGERVERGVVLDLTPEEAANIPDDVEKYVSDEEVVEEPAPEIAVEDMNVAQLKEKAVSLGLATTGSKADLLERIALHATDTEDITH